MAFNLDTIGQGMKRVASGINHFTQPIERGLENGLHAIGSKVRSFLPRSSQQATPSPYHTPTPGSAPVGLGYQNHLKEIKDIEGSFKKGGEVKKTGNYKVHKGEYVISTKDKALKEKMADRKGRGYTETNKTNENKKYSWEKSQNYRDRTGFYKTKVDGQGHSIGFKWAQEQGIDYKERKRKYGRNSPSFDEGVHEYKRHSRESALEHKKK